VVPDLLIDREAGTVIVYSEPAEDRCTRAAEIEISKTVALPEPLGFDLDTSRF
jgi:hypothetical protein